MTEVGAAVPEPAAEANGEDGEVSEAAGTAEEPAAVAYRVYSPSKA